MAVQEELRLTLSSDGPSSHFNQPFLKVAFLFLFLLSPQPEKSRPTQTWD